MRRGLAPFVALALAGGACLCGDPNLNRVPCGDRTCDPAGETCSSCPQDCACAAGKECEGATCVSLCGNGSCDGLKGESCVTCAEDCGCAPGRTCIASANACILTCGDNACVADHGENCVTCAADCACGEGFECVASTGACRQRCGNGTCEAAAGENCATCEADCACNGAIFECHEGACRLRCGNATCDTGNGEGCTTCDTDCACSGPTKTCATNVCTDSCGTGGCEASKGENCATCATDCGCNAVTEECFNNGCRLRCGNGSCNSGDGENCTTCPADCGCTSSQTCNPSTHVCDQQTGTCTNPCSFSWLHSSDLKVNAGAQGYLGGPIAFDPGGDTFVGYGAGNSYLLAKIASAGSSFTQVAAAINSESGAYFYGAKALFSGGANKLYALWDYVDSDGVQPYLGSHVKFASSTNAGVNWSSNTPVDTAATTDNAFEVDAAYVGTTLYVAYTGFYAGCTVSSCYEAFFTKSTNGGTSWSAPLRLTNDTKQDDHVGVGVDGQVVVVASKTFDGNVLVARSSDGGSSFSPAVRVNDVLDKAGYGWHEFVAVRGQRVHVTWSDTRTDGEGEIYIDTSNDGGQTWGTDVHVNDVTNRWQEQPSLEIAPNGRVWVLWRDFRNGNDYDLWASSSEDGACFCQPARFNKDTGTDHTEPYFAIDAQGRLHGAWRDGNGAGPDIKYNAAVPTFP